LNTGRKWILVFFASALALLIAPTSSAPVRAGDTQCAGSLGVIEVENLVVPENASCILNGTIVDGNISVKTNATLHAYAVRVTNDIQADKAAGVNVYAGSSVGGNVKIAKSGAADIQSVDIDNNLNFNENDQSVNAANNTIGGNLQATKNTGGVSINGNHIGGNLQCKDNDPAPTGSSNIVIGNMEDQCADFGGVPTPIPTNTPVIDDEAPTVQWIAPVLAGEIYDIYEGEQVLLAAEAWDNGSIQNVMFIRWDAVNLQHVTIGTLDSAPFQININASTFNPGWNQVFVMASDEAGNKSDDPFIWLYRLAEEKMNTLIFLPILENNLFVQATNN